MRTARQILAGAAMLALMAALPARAQEIPVVEMAGGGSFAHTTDHGSHDALGWYIMFGFRAWPHVRLLGDFGGQYEASDIVFQGQRARQDTYQLLWGPEVISLRARTAPFAHALAGVAARHLTVTSDTPGGVRDVLNVDYGAALAAGGGVEFRLARHFNFRPQIDYIATHLSTIDPQFSPVEGQFPALPAAWRNNFRVSFSLGFNVGSRTAVR